MSNNLYGNNVLQRFQSWVHMPRRIFGALPALLDSRRWTWWALSTRYSCNTSDTHRTCSTAITVVLDESCHSNDNCSMNLALANACSTRNTLNTWYLFLILVILILILSNAIPAHPWGWRSFISSNFRQLPTSYKCDKTGLSPKLTLTEQFETQPCSESAVSLLPSTKYTRGVLRETWNISCLRWMREGLRWLHSVTLDIIISRVFTNKSTNPVA